MTGKSWKAMGIPWRAGLCLLGFLFLTSDSSGQCSPSNPVADFSFSTDTLLCPGETVNFYSTSSAYKPSVLWDFGASGSADTASGDTVSFQFIHTDTSTRVFHVRLLVIDSCGNLDSVSQDFYVNPGLEANFSFSPNPYGCDSVPISFTNLSAGRGLTYSWNFGDPGSSGNISTSANPTHRYDIGSNTDTFTVKLIVTDSCGNSDSLERTVIVAPFPVSSFSFTDSLCSGNLSFTNTSTGTGLSYQWDFGDVQSGSRNSSSATNPTHLYDTTGTGYASFQVKLKVTNAFGCTDSLVRTRYVQRGPHIDLLGNYVNCGTGSSHQLVVYNNSNTVSSNAQYLIYWGDTVTNIDTLTSLTFDTNVYNGTGAWNLRIRVISNSGCAREDTITVFNGTNPSGGLASPGNTTNLCAPDTVGFIPTNYTNNPSGTTYIFSVDDGSNPQTFNHPPPDTIYHIFSSSSCSVNGNSYTATLRIENPCGFTTATVTPITVNRAPNAGFNVSNDTPCVDNELVTLTENTTGGSHVFFSGGTYTCNTTHLRYWTITPSSYQLVSGTLGTNLIPSAAGTSGLSLRFTDTGVYTITLHTGFNIFASPSFPCGTTQMTRTIYVIDTVRAAFTINLNPSNGCVNNIFTPTNNSTGPIQSQRWRVTPNSGYSFTNGNQNSLAPTFRFTEAGIYEIELEVEGQCNEDDTATTITIRSRPEVFLPGDTSYCGPQSINMASTLHAPVIDTNFSSISAYRWQVSGGAYAFTAGTDSTWLDARIQFQDTGVYRVLFTATNACGTSIADTQFIHIRPVPVMTQPADILVCPGDQINPQVFATTPGGASFTWVNSDTSIGLAAAGTGNIAAFTARQNNGTTTISGTVTVTPELNGCVGNPADFEIGIKPTPLAAAISDLDFCPGQTVTVPAFSSSPAGAAFSWTNSNDSIGLASSGSGNIGSWTAPQNLGTAPIVGVIRYVPVLNSCAGPADSFEIAIRTRPVMSGIQDTVVCPNQTFTYPSFTSVPSGANFEWFNNNTSVGLADSGTGNLPAFTTFNNLSGSNVTARIVVFPNYNVCVGVPDTFLISVRPVPVIQAISDTSVCPGDTVFIPAFSANPSGGSFSWVNSNAQTGLAASGTGNIQSFASLPNTSGAVRVSQIRVLPVLNGCSGPEDTFEIRVKPSPIPTSLSDILVCPGDSVKPSAFGSNPSGSSFTWVNTNDSIGLGASGSGNLPDFVASVNNGTVPITGRIRYTPVLNQCIGPADSFSISIRPTPVMLGKPDLEFCTWDTINPGAFSTLPSGATFSWTNTNPSIGLAASGSGNISGWIAPANTGGNLIQGSIVVIPVLNTCPGLADTFAIGIRPQPQADAGSGDTLCNGQSIQIGQTPVSGESYTWTSLPGGFSDTASQVVVQPAVSTQYILQVYDSTTQCRQRDTVLIAVNPVIASNAISADQTICAGQSPTGLTGSSVNGGNGNYSFQWQQSTDSTTWSLINGATSQHYSPGTLNVNTHFRRVTVSGPCSDTSGVVRITVLPGLASNFIGSHDSICAFFAPDTLRGSTPTGGNGSYSYTWQQSSDTTQSVTTINGATGMDYFPGTLTTTTYFRRVTASGACEVPGNWVQIRVFPKPAASFVSSNACFDYANTFSNTSGISSGSIDTLYWDFGDTTGSGANAPNHTYAFAGAKQVKLIVSSDFGCRDSVTRTVYVHPKPLAAFDSTNACHGLANRFTGQSTISAGSLAGYSWDFGDGNASSQVSPDHIYADTGRYSVKLIITSDSGCMDSAFRSVEVYPKPIAQFTGEDVCFNQSTHFTDQSTLSAGSLVSWFWDLGNGDTSWQRHPVQDYAAADTLTVTLYIQSDRGCRDTADTEVIVYPSISNNTISGEDTICVGGSTAAFSGSNAAGGTGSYVYQWQSSTDSSNWSDLSGANSVNLSAQAPVVNTWYRRVVTSSPCDTNERSISNIVLVVVTPGLGNNGISTDQVICYGQIPDTLRGSLPSGGTGTFQYQWQQSSDGSSYTDITGAGGLHYLPGMMTDTLWFRRIVYSQACDLVSNAVKVAVKPLPVPGFTLQNVCFPEVSVFSDTSEINQGTVASVTFYFGDGDSSNQFTPSHSYNSAGSYQVRLVAVSNFGCVDSVSRTYTVYPKPEAVIYQQNTCDPFAMNFRDTSSVSSGSLVSWKWRFGDGDSSLSQHPVHTYPADGSYTSWLEVTTDLGCKDSTDRMVRVFPKPEPGWAATEVCFPDQTDFTDTSSLNTGNLQSWYWDFGDGNAGTAQNPVHTYAAAGTYTVKLIVQSDSNCFDSLSRTIEVRPLPVVDFSFDTLSCLNASIPVTNQSTLSQAQVWTFGNGDTDTAFHPQTTYTAIGSYLIKQVATSPHGCIDSNQRNIRIIAPPVAAISLSLDSGCGPLAVSISNHSVNEFPTWTWDLGTGGTFTDTFPPGQVYVPSIHTDTTYYVRLIAGNKCGTDTAVDSVLVLPVPTAVLGLAADQGCSPLHLQLFNASYGRPLGYYWDYGDGNTSDNGFGVHTKTFLTGTDDTVYTITLIAENQCGTDTAEDQILVKPNTVTAFFNTDTTRGCAPLEVNFTDFSTGGNYLYYDFGDGNTSLSEDPVHVFQTPGTYTVRQFVDNGCSFDTTETRVTVLPGIMPVFSLNPNPQCLGTAVNFSHSTPGAGAVRWYFGDGDSSDLSNPAHAYTSDGTFYVTLRAISAANGCPGSRIDSVLILPLPGSQLSIPVNNGCPPFSLSVQNQTGNGQFYTWHFGDGNSATGLSPGHTYTQTGTYSVKLISVSSQGCIDSAEAPVTVHPVPVAAFGFSFDTECDTPSELSFTNLSSGAASYQWTFGDGGNSVLTNPVHAYHQFATYTIGLRAENSFGCFDTTSDSHTVFPVPVALFTLDPDSGCEPLEVQFTNLSQNTVSWLWDFGDGTTSDQSDPIHTYTGAGFYDVRLVAVGGGSCSASYDLSRAVLVYPKPVASFSVTQLDNDPVAMGRVQFTNQSVDADFYHWDFGDGSESGLENPEHRYAYHGSYIVQLAVSNQYGCEDTTIQEIPLTFFKGLYVPNAFTPEYGTPEVRVFKPSGTSLKTYRLSIYDTYGNLLWESTALENGMPAEGWDGRVDGKLLNQDVYVWKVEAEFTDGTKWAGMKDANGRYRKEGTLTLIR